MNHREPLNLYSAVKLADTKTKQTQRLEIEQASKIITETLNNDYENKV